MNLRPSDLPHSRNEYPLKEMRGLKAAHYEARPKDAALNMRLSPALMEDVRARAQAMGLSLAGYVRAVLEESLTESK